MAFLVWTLLAASAVYWLIQLSAKPLATPAQALPVAERAGGQAELTRLFGAPPATAAAPVAAAEGRFRLLGVVAPTARALSADDQGVALIAVDGVARTVRVGAEVADGLRLLRLDSRSADLGGADGAPSVTLQLAPPNAASTGTLVPAAPSPVNLGGPTVVPSPTMQGPLPGTGPQLPPVQLQQSAPQLDSQGRPAGNPALANQ